VNAIIRFSHKMVYPKLTIQFVNPNCPIVYSKQKDAFMANLELDTNLLTKKKKKKIGHDSQGASHFESMVAF
jgi:hypothetical protein